MTTPNITLSKIEQTKGDEETKNNCNRNTSLNRSTVKPLNAVGWGEGVRAKLEFLVKLTSQSNAKTTVIDITVYTVSLRTDRPEQKM